MSQASEATVAARATTITVRATQEEVALVKRCADHFNEGTAEPEVSSFVRNLAILYAIDHGLPLFEGDVAGGVGENEDKRKLETKKSKLAEGMKRMRARKGGE